jgi:hypothetical protein
MIPDLLNKMARKFMRNGRYTKLWAEKLGYYLRITIKFLRDQ